jgi:hypothetical protein
LHQDIRQRLTRKDLLEGLGFPLADVAVSLRRSELLDQHVEVDIDRRPCPEQVDRRGEGEVIMAILRKGKGGENRSTGFTMTAIDRENVA